MRLTLLVELAPVSGGRKPSRRFARNPRPSYVLACDMGEPLTDRRREALCGFSVGVIGGSAWLLPVSL